MIKDVYAAPVTPDPGTPGDGLGIKNPVLGNNLQSLFDTSGGAGYVARLISTLVTLIFIIGSIVFFFQLAAGGVEWITSGGDKAKLESARGKITSALIGLVILFSVYAIVSLIESIFGINILILDISKLIIR